MEKTAPVGVAARFVKTALPTMRSVCPSSIETAIGVSSTVMLSPGSAVIDPITNASAVDGVLWLSSVTWTTSTDTVVD